MISFADIGFTWLYFTADEKTRLKKILLIFTFSIPPFALVQLRWCPVLLQVPWILLQRSQFWEILCGYFHREAENGTPFRKSWVKCSLHTYTYLGFGRPNLLSRRIWSSHCLAASGFFTGKLWKLTPLTLSFLDLLLQPRTKHDHGIFSSQHKNETHAGNL